MKCPHCKYIDSWNSKDPTTYKGNFFMLEDVEMKRGINPNPERKSVYGCPHCGKLFMDI